MKLSLFSVLLVVLCVADGSSGASVTDAEILALSEELSGLDVNNVATEVVINLHATTGPLFIYVPELTADTYVLFKELRDNYERDTNDSIATASSHSTSYKLVKERFEEHFLVSVPEDNTLAEQAEVTAFLDAVMATSVMVRLELFMFNNQLITGTLRENIEEIWFTLYSRSGSILGSSGFENIFMGEIDGDYVEGFNNWVSYEIEEASGDATYNGNIFDTDLGTSGYILYYGFDWHGAKRSLGSLYEGTSLEFELAIYTLCFFARPNFSCGVQTNGVEYYIQTYEFHSGNQTLVGSAYPI